MFLIVYWLTSNIWAVLGKAAAAATLYTESASQSVVGSQSDIIRQSCLTITAIIRIEHEIVSVLLIVSLNEHNEFTKQCLHSLTPRSHASPTTRES